MKNTVLLKELQNDKYMLINETECNQCYNLNAVYHPLPYYRHDNILPYAPIYWNKENKDYL